MKQTFLSFAFGLGLVSGVCNAEVVDTPLGEWKPFKRAYKIDLAKCKADFSAWKSSNQAAECQVKLAGVTSPEQTLEFDVIKKMYTDGDGKKHMVVLMAGLAEREDAAAATGAPRDGGYRVVYGTTASGKTSWEDAEVFIEKTVAGVKDGTLYRTVLKVVKP